MVRFKVVKGSHLLLGIAAIVLAGVIAAMVANAIFEKKTSPAGTHASLVRHADEEIRIEAKTEKVFASIDAEKDALELDPEGEGIDIDILSRPHAEGMSVLIYHTHTHEAYEQVAEDRYVAIEAWRTVDQDYSVVRVGNELAQLLRARGFSVVHDTTDHEQNELGTAYTRSLATLEAYEETFDLYIDLHRDAYIDGMQTGSVCDKNGSLAQLMVLIGNGNGFDVKPFYRENLAFAQQLTRRINEKMPGLCKDVLVKDGRYNQNIGVFSILIEVGHNRNTLSEALRSLPYLADGIHSVLIGEPDVELMELMKMHRG